MVATVSSEVTVYGAVGAVFLFLLVALLLGLSFSSPCKAGNNSKYLSSNNLGYDRDQVNYKNHGQPTMSFSPFRNCNFVNMFTNLLLVQLIIR